jgi:hypothetical protein
LWEGFRRGKEARSHSTEPKQQDIVRHRAFVIARRSANWQHYANANDSQYRGGIMASTLSISCSKPAQAPGINAAHSNFYGGRLTRASGAGAGREEAGCAAVVWLAMGAGNEAMLHGLSRISMLIAYYIGNEYNRAIRHMNSRPRRTWPRRYGNCAYHYALETSASTS